MSRHEIPASGPEWSGPFNQARSQTTTPDQFNLQKQFKNFDWETLALRGQRLTLGRTRWSDDAGNSSTYLVVAEIDDEGLVVGEGRFDEDDFASAYDELENRYYAGEAAAFAEPGMALARNLMAKNLGDLDTLFGQLSTVDLRVDSRSTSLFTSRTASEYRASIEELSNLVASVQEWVAAVEWISPNWCVGRHQRVAIGHDDERYEWDRLIACEMRGGRNAHVCIFEIDDEDAAFAYAQERARASATRLAVTNRAAEVLAGMDRALSRGDAEVVVDAYREDCCHDDRRRLAGGPLPGRAELRAAVDRILQQFNDFQWRTLAVRGQGLAMGWTRWSDDFGNMSTYLVVAEVDDNDRIIYEGWFDEDDFESAYHELDRRFFAGEGAVFADKEVAQTGLIDALNRLDRDTGRRVCLPSFRVVSPPTTLATEERSFTQFFDWIEKRAEQAPSVRNWLSAIRWLSENCMVIRIEIRTIGPAGEDYSWPRIAVGELRGGRIAYIRQFDIDDEEAAFAYADTVVAKYASRLSSTNIASEVAEAMNRAMSAGDIDALVDLYTDDCVFGDRRRLSGDPIQGRAAMRSAAERLLGQFSDSEARVLAVRGEHLCLAWSRWSDDAGNQTAHLHVLETGGDGRIVYAGRFDEDDFEGAYLELERRYYAGEGAAFAENGLVAADYATVMNRGDFDTMVNELTGADFRLENRSRSPFPDRSAADLRTSLEQLYSMVESARTWFSAIAWVSPTMQVIRMEREAVGRDGQPYSWSRILVATWEDGRLASLGDFEADDEDAAFAHAEGI